MGNYEVMVYLYHPMRMDKELEDTLFALNENAWASTDKLLTQYVYRMRTLMEVREALEKSWGQDTTYCTEDWTEQHPSYGQCAVSALIVQDELGGVLKKGWVRDPNGEDRRHYWNYVNGMDIDLTWAQFPTGSRIALEELASREDMIDNEWMEERYRILRERVSAYLATFPLSKPNI